ncbi:Lrp/AsnC family transcriptional regulator [Bartonella tamiae]|uniref:HTH asnC-type domain-containing protein n=1 Tax=Bartonella tamiae Th239 TaxID=1094558 RepID=J0ZLM4_9HYPH|nr:Lrp/AsnC family transcriptional regulator [Bartonella tamiae]EJF89318.1 hypothetical protein ME5_01869 [Bartonella tamiae Th239]EJF95520.1 hypothetical protein MEG_00010 [Bartonella tamiae Th307]
MDQIDLKLIELLRRDARVSISEISSRLNISRATVRARMKKLEKKGVIRGYSIILHNDKTDNFIRGIMMIEVDRHNADRVADILSAFPEVDFIHTTNGRFDLIIELKTQNLAEFDTILRNIRLVSGIKASETHLLLATRRAVLKSR